MQFAALSALIGSAIVLAAGFLQAIALPETSFVDLGTGPADLWGETLTHAATTTLATLEVSFEGGAIALRSAPILFVLFPIGGCALGAYLLARRTAALPPTLRYAWGAAIGIPFALLMLVISLSAGSVSEPSGSSLSPSEGSVLILSLLWGGLGGLAGTTLALRGGGLPFSSDSLLDRGLSTAGAVLKPLAVALAVLSVLAVALWAVQIVRDAGDSRSGRSLATALLDDILFAGDLGYRYQALGSGAEFGLFNDDLLGLALASAQEEEDSSETAPARFLPIPVVESKVSGGLIEEQGFDAIDGKFRIFNYGDVLPGWAFAPILAALMAIPAFLALYAGFGVSRANGAVTPLAGAAWGALVGPLWGVSLALLSTLTQDIDFGQVDSDNLFVLTLFLGAALGALGGIGAAQQQADMSEPSVTPASGRPSG